MAGQGEHAERRLRRRAVGPSYATVSVFRSSQPSLLTMAGETSAQGAQVVVEAEIEALERATSGPSNQGDARFKRVVTGLIIVAWCAPSPLPPPPPPLLPPPAPAASSRRQLCPSPAAGRYISNIALTMTNKVLLSVYDFRCRPCCGFRLY